MQKAIEEAKKFVCTTKERIVKDAKEFIQNVDCKKVAIGVARNQLIDGTTDNRTIKDAVGDSLTDNKAVKNAIADSATDNKAVKNAVKDSTSEATNVGLKNGSNLKTNDALDAAEDFLGKGYKDAGNGRFISADGTKVVRMGDNDILGKHGGGPHMNFETMAPNPAKPGKMQVIDNMHIYLED